MIILKLIKMAIACVFIVCMFNAEARDYYFHPRSGNDQNSGYSMDQPFQSLQVIKRLTLLPGDRILLASGEVFYGSLQIENLHGKEEAPIIIDSYSVKGANGLKAIINASGYFGGIVIRNSSHIQIRNLEVTANGGGDPDGQWDMRVGVLITNKAGEYLEGITLQGLDIYDVFYEEPGTTRSSEEVRTANGTQKYGWGIRVISSDANATIERIKIRNCKVRNVSHTGIKLTGGREKNIRRIELTDNVVTQSGGPGIQMSNVAYVYVAGNTVDYSGSTNDSRKWGRGSGLWTWSASNVLIEKNRFMNANGPGDSAGAHIDYNCDNVILQYNFSANNAGGFCEILGNNYNCAYRYNISVNDGHRIKGENGAFQEGKVFWLSGYQGDKRERKGPVNSYFYNNTVYVKAGQDSKIAVDNRSNGLVIVNNIFHLIGPVKMVQGDQYRPDDGFSDGLANTIFKNNLFLTEEAWPSESMIRDESPIVGDAKFRNPGGLRPEDYIPAASKLVIQGIAVPFAPQDEFGLIHGIRIDRDFFGNRISGNPGIGAIKVDAGR